MGFFSFIKNAGAKTLDSVTENSTEQGTKLLQVQESIKQLKLPDADKIKVEVNDGKVTISGEGISQASREKIQAAVSSVEGISGVDNQIVASDDGVESRQYIVKRGDTLSAIAKAEYGNARYTGKILKANDHILKGNPDKIYPG